MPPKFNNVFEECTNLTQVNFSSMPTFGYSTFIHQRDPIDQAYEIVFNTMLSTVSKEEIDEYRTLLKMYNNDYRLTVLAIEVDKTTK